MNDKAKTIESADELMEELQTIWDMQSARVEELVSRPEAQPRRLNLRHSVSWRRRTMAEYLALAVASLAVGVCSAVVLVGHSDLLVRIAGCGLVAAAAFIVVQCVNRFLTFRIYNPARVGIMRMSRFIGRNPVERHYAPHPATPERRSVTAYLRSAVLTAFSSSRQVAAVCATAVLVLVVVSCTVKDDGPATSEFNPAARTSAIANIDAILAQQ